MFGCVQKGCGKQSSCWRAFRLQVPEQADLAPVPSTVTDSDSQRPPTLEIPSAVDALTSADAGADIAPSERTGGGFSLEGLRSALEASCRQKKARSKPQRKRQTAPLSEKSEKISWNVELPEFYICGEEESDPKHNGSLEADLRVRESVERYMQDTTDAASWQNESYEKPDYKTADGAAFVKFQKKLEVSPIQCVRYGFDRELLNPTSNTFDVPDCRLCGSRCVFELQLMPHLIYALYEAAEWLHSKTAGGDAPDDRTAMAVQNASTCSMEWEWASVAIFTCSQSCSPSDTCTAEQVVVLNEPN